MGLQRLEADRIPEGTYWAKDDSSNVLWSYSHADTPGAKLRGFLRWLNGVLPELYVLVVTRSFESQQQAGHPVSEDRVRYEHETLQSVLSDQNLQTRHIKFEDVV